VRAAKSAMPCQKIYVPATSARNAARGCVQRYSATALPLSSYLHFFVMLSLPSFSYDSCQPYAFSLMLLFAVVIPEYHFHCFCFHADVAFFAFAAS